MKSVATLSVLVLFSMSILNLSGRVDAAGSSQQGEGCTGAYLGISGKPPAGGAVRFAEDIVCTFMDEWAICFTPRGDEIYFALTGNEPAAIVRLVYEDKQWKGPEVMEFSGIHFDGAPRLSHDGRTMIFTSRRPKPGSTSLAGSNLWICSRTEAGPHVPWSAPEPLPWAEDMSEWRISWPFLDGNGDLYFSAEMEDGYGESDIYRSSCVDGVFQKPELLSSPINSEYGEYCPYISPDGSWIAVEVIGDPEGTGRGDIYFSFKQDDGCWGERKNPGDVVNSRGNDFLPVVSPDGRYILFGSDRQIRDSGDDLPASYSEIRKRGLLCGGFDIYWVDVETVMGVLK